MNISNVSATTSTGTSGKYDSVVNALQKQKDELTKQIAEVRASKQDSKTKAEKIKQLTTQIADIDQQIAQAKVDAQQREIKEAQEKAAQKAAEKAELKKYEEQLEENGPGVVLSPSLKKILTADKNISDYQTMHAVRTKIKGEMAVAQSEISNSHKGSVKYQMDVISNKSSALAGLENKMVKKVDEVTKDIKSAVKLGVKEAEKNRENNDEPKKADKKTSSTDSASDETIEPDTVATPADDSQYLKDLTEVQEKKGAKNNKAKYKSVDVTV